MTVTRMGCPAPRFSTSWGSPTSSRVVVAAAFWSGARRRASGFAPSSRRSMSACAHCESRGQSNGGVRPTACGRPHPVSRGEREYPAGDELCLFRQPALVQVAQPPQPEPLSHMGAVRRGDCSPPSPRAYSAQPLSRAAVQDPDWEPDGVTLQVRFCEGPGTNCRMVEILWHRRATRRQQRTPTST